MENHYTEFNVLYKLSKVPYNPRKSFSTCKEFTSSYNKIEKEFVLEELKQMAPGLGIEPRLTESKSVVLPLHNPGIKLERDIGLEPTT